MHVMSDLPSSLTRAGNTAGEVLQRTARGALVLPPGGRQPGAGNKRARWTPLLLVCRRALWVAWETREGLDAISTSSRGDEGSAVQGTVAWLLSVLLGSGRHLWLGQEPAGHVVPTCIQAA